MGALVFLFYVLVVIATEALEWRAIIVMGGQGQRVICLAPVAFCFVFLFSSVALIS